jgi:tRNA dimethylallyltransferase
VGVLPRIIVITGPTGSGKSALALNLAKSIDGELINADSVQVYQDFDIGSAKPSAEEMSAVPHHLFSALNPKQHFDAETFRCMAKQAIKSVLDRGRIPIVVGGTGLYIRSLLCGLVPLEPIAPNIIEEIDRQEQLWMEEAALDPQSSERERKLLVSNRLHQWLNSIDELTAETLHPSDANRIKRALSVKLSSGVSLLEQQERHAHSNLEYQPLVIAISPDRELLYQRIDRRVDTMFEVGFMEEVVSLREKYDESCRAFASLGYRHVVEFLEGKTSEEEMRHSMKRDTRRFAKRQLTWWRNQPEKLGWEISAPEKFFDVRDKSNFSNSSGKDDIHLGFSDGLTGGIMRFLDVNQTPERRVIEFLSISDMDVTPKRCNSL